VVDPSRAPRVTAEQASRGQRTSPHWTVDAQGADGVRRAGRVVATARLPHDGRRPPQMDRGEEYRCQACAQRTDSPAEDRSHDMTVNTSSLPPSRSSSSPTRNTSLSALGARATRTTSRPSRQLRALAASLRRRLERFRRTAFPTRFDATTVNRAPVTVGSSDTTRSRRWSARSSPAPLRPRRSTFWTSSERERRPGRADATRSDMLRASVTRSAWRDPYGDGSSRSPDRRAYAYGDGSRACETGDGCSVDRCASSRTSSG